jgi:hypothetical protein
MAKKWKDLTVDERLLLEYYYSLNPEAQIMVDIVLKIASSHILSNSEFHTLIQNLMHISPS